MNKIILNSDIQAFIKKHIGSNIHELILKGNPFESLDIKELIEQIEAKKKCALKLKTWFETPGIYYPNKLNIEQTSSETAALIKSEFMQGASLVDLTGGFGVDSYYFSKQFKQVVHCEMDSKLAEIAAYNFEILGAKNIESHNKDGIEFLKTYPDTFDWIYIDPSRRDGQKNKKFLIEDCSPNVITHQDLFFKHAKNVLIKMSPMLDISVGITALKHVKTVYIVAVKNEVKELLFHQEKDFDGTATIQTLNSHPKSTELFSFEIAEEENAEATFSSPKTYLYEPNAAVMKSGAFKLISEKFKLDKLDPHTHLYTSDKKIEKFPGKIYQISNTLPYQKKPLKKAIGGLKANVKTRNFPEKIEVLKTLFKLTDGGDLYLFFTTSNDKKIVVEGRLVD
ncbi:class I SAM-dependent methyltransferase [Flavobacteriaceae bacterium]|nr:class I SAM-dependent methyltransferase [Flavobacteriaceae bacterium]